MPNNPTSYSKYLGNLRVENTHLKSKNTFITDAPVDNNGKGEAFSPTDTVATALASCMLTVMGIKAIDLELDLEGAHAFVTKTMGTNPRRIIKIEVEINMPFSFSEKNKKILEHTAKTCPVLYSLHPEIEKEVFFNWL